MSTQVYRHGGLLGLWLCSAAAAAGPPDPRHLFQVQTRTFEIEYRVNESALPLERVELWYTLDSGVTWHNYGADEDLQSPIQFTAPQEGQYGFLIVASNRTGRSSEPPVSGTAPQHWAFVDYTPPVVQFHPVRAGSRSHPRTLHLKWTAIDAHLVSRPVGLAYRELPDGPWRAVARTLSNAGRYDWRVPDDLEGRILLRISVRDRGGHKAEAVAGVVDLSTVFATKPDVAPTTQPARTDDVPPPPTAEQQARARRLFQRGVWHQLRGEHRLAISRLKDALALDPTLTDALVELGGALYAVSGLDDAIQAYELALAQDARSRAALEGSAEAYVAARRYDSAAENLRRLLRLYPEDAAAWLNLGDVEMRRGDELSARESYTKAATLDPEAKEVIARARRRLANMELVRERVGRLVELQEATPP